MLPFHIPFTTENELARLHTMLESQSFASGGSIGQRVEQQLNSLLNTQQVLLTGSCTQALELAALLCNISPGDEVILPSYTFVSTANAFALRGAKLVFIDVRPDTMNFDVQQVAAAITPRTRAIVAMHYGGVACDMEPLLDLAAAHNIWLIEDAAHGIGASWRNRPLGSIGHLGALSFHETKNIQCGEGGALVINDERLLERAQILRDKGTNRMAFLQGKVPAYTWVDLGSSFGMSELQASFLSAQLEALPEVTSTRRSLWQQYHQTLRPLEAAGYLKLPAPPSECQHNGHLFFILCRSETLRKALQQYLLSCGIQTAFHYQPLHQSEGGRRWGSNAGSMQVVERESPCLLRLPLYVPLPAQKVAEVCSHIESFFKQGLHD